MNTVKKILIPLMLMSLLMGCGMTKAPETRGITINENGSIQALIVEDFDENVYSSADLQTFLSMEIAEFNSANGANSVTGYIPEIKEGNIYLTMDYADASAYSGFNDRILQIMTAKEAFVSDAVGANLIAINNGTPCDMKTIADEEGAIVVITDEAGRVSCPGKILYISDGVTANSKKEVQVSEDMDGLAYIVYKNK